MSVLRAFQSLVRIPDPHSARTDGLLPPRVKCSTLQWVAGGQLLRQDDPKNGIRPKSIHVKRSKMSPAVSRSPLGSCRCLSPRSSTVQTHIGKQNDLKIRRSTASAEEAKCVIHPKILATRNRSGVEVMWWEVGLESTWRELVPRDWTRCRRWSRPTKRKGTPFALSFGCGVVTPLVHYRVGLHVDIRGLWHVQLSILTSSETD